MNRKKIGIIGCGAAGTYIFAHIVADCLRTKSQDLVAIYIFAKSADIAKGLPYNFDNDCN